VDDFANVIPQQIGAMDVDSIIKNFGKYEVEKIKV